MSPTVKFLVEAGPLIAFFIANWKGGIFWGTGIFMAATIVALAVSWFTTGKIAKVPLVGAVFVAIFGALTLWLQDETFIKVKVTLVNALFGAILLGGLYFGRLFLKTVMGEAFKMNNDGWRILTWRWGIFFFALAGLNELVWRTQSTDVWVNFKVFGLLPITFAFAMLQLPLMTKNAVGEKTH